MNNIGSRAPGHPLAVQPRVSVPMKNIGSRAPGHPLAVQPRVSENVNTKPGVPRKTEAPGLLGTPPRQPRVPRVSEDVDTKPGVPDEKRREGSRAPPQAA